MVIRCTGVLCVVLLCSLTVTAEPYAKVSAAKSLYPAQAPTSNKYGEAKDGGNVWVVETQRGGSDGVIYLLDSRTMSLKRCKVYVKSYINKLKLKYKTQTKCDGYSDTSCSSSSNNGSVACSFCQMARRMGNGGNGTVDAWFRGKHRSC